MKLSLFMNVLLISSLSLLAVGCGKDKKKGGSNNNVGYNYYNPYVGTQTPSASGVPAETNLQNYLSAVESKQNILGMINIAKIKYSCNDLFGISFIQSCGSKLNTSENIFVGPNLTRAQIKPSLANVMTPPAGFTYGSTVQYGNIAYVTHYQGSNIYEYTIDMSRHAVVNPVQVKDTLNKKLEYVVSPTY